MEYNIGDNIEVTVGNKKYNGLILDIKDNVLTIIYVGKNNNGSSFAITDIFDKEGNLIEQLNFINSVIQLQQLLK